MYGHNRNSGISWFRDYGDAFHKYQSTTDIRGRVEEPKRPLGHRRSIDTYSIRLKQDGSMGVECVLYRTPVVTFYPNGLVELRNDGWNSVSTAYFIEEVLGHYVSARIFNNSLCVSVNGIETRMGYKDTIIQIKDGKILNPMIDKAHKIIRGKANNVRKQYAEFVKYGSALVRLKAEGFMASEYEETFGIEQNSRHVFVGMPNEISRAHNTYFPEDVQAFFALVNATGEDKHIAHYKAVLTLAWAMGSMTYSPNFKVTGTHLTEQAFKRAFDGLVLGYHRDEVFTETEREEGEVKRDTYQKYYESGWRRFHEGTLTKLCKVDAQLKNLHC